MTNLLLTPRKPVERRNVADRAGRGRHGSLSMNAAATFLSVIATLLYLATMLLVLRMVRDAGDRRPWLLLLAALLILLALRILSISVAVEVRRGLGPWLGVAVSALLLASLYYFRLVTVAERESKALAQRRTVERDESESRYRALAELRPDVMFVSVGGKITYVNAAAMRFFGATDAWELLGRSPAELAAPESRSRVAAWNEQLTEIGEQMPVASEEWLRLDSSRVPVEAAAGLVPWQGGRGILVILRDVSERKKAEEEKTQLLASERSARKTAERASQMKEEFLANLSHELRTPLNTILGWSQILASGRLTGPELTKGLETIERNARAQAQLVEDLLDMSAIMSGKLRLEIQRLNPVSFVEAAIETIKLAAESKRIRLETQLDPHAGTVYGDANRLQQVVWNLLTNAVKFTPEEGTVKVALKREGPRVEIAVLDTGQGISEEFLSYVFDRFRQADATIRRKHHGLGLGLAIVKQLVELHGGSVSAESDGEGRGAAFVVKLPLAVAADQTRMVPSDLATPSNGLSSGRVDLSGIKVLVVDDEPDARSLVKWILDECRAEVLTAASASEAMPLFAASRPDILISDIGMPGVDGYEFLRRIRSLDSVRGGTVPAIALTAYARPEDLARSLKVGYAVHVPKPVVPDSLMTSVAALAGRIPEPSRDEGDDSRRR
jgi:PAS domain S-box-containing protein